MWKRKFKSLFALISSCNWRINTMDIKSAFLYGKSIEKDVFLKPPKKANTKKLWKLKTTVYGLCDAPWEWYLSAKKSCLQQGVLRIDTMIQYSICIKKTPYTHRCTHRCTHGWLLLGRNKVINHIPNVFPISKEELQTFKYHSLNIPQTNHGIFMHQKEYIWETEVV